MTCQPLKIDILGLFQTRFGPNCLFLNLDNLIPKSLLLKLKILFSNPHNEPSSKNTVLTSYE